MKSGCDRGTRVSQPLNKQSSPPERHIISTFTVNNPHMEMSSQLLRMQKYSIHYPALFVNFLLFGTIRYSAENLLSNKNSLCKGAGSGGQGGTVALLPSDWGARGAKGDPPL